MIPRVAPFVLLALVHASQSASGQTPGLHVDAKRLKTGVDTLAVFLIRGSDTTRTGTIVDHLRAEKDRLIRVYTTTDAVLGNGIDTIVSSLDGLRPLSYATHSASRIARLSFQPSEVHGWTRLPNGDSVTIQQALPADVFDGSSFDLILRASALGPDVKLVVPAFLLGSNTVSTLSGSVTGTDVVDQRSCWVVNANFAGMPVTFWIDKETRRLRRQLMQPRVDMAILFAAPKPKGGSTFRNG